MNLKNKVVIITGGSRGFGMILAQHFLKEGLKVVISSNDEKELKEVSDKIGVYGVYGDVTKEEDMTSLVEETVKKFGVIDIWINNAGMWMNGIAEDTDMDKVRKMFEVNVFGLMNGSRVALRYMKEKNSGVIMNIISTSALSGRSNISTYCSSKWAANGFTKAIREENKDKNIRILSVFPGGMKTEIFGKDRPDNFNDFMEVEPVVEKVINNLKKELPEEELIIQRPTK